ncbi:transposase-like protein [Paenibacillus silagei]|uniref:Transposase-like protein n=1 Tax=Paenibacillus silagei TaxID=1670801 RepID=A0ABS4NNQ3_9BACL|nr:transposase-like protein [Paenibacillus silagei]
MIESYRRQLRKVSKGKSIFPKDEALLKMLNLTTVDVNRKWTRSVQNWGQMLLQLSVFFPDWVSQCLRYITNPPSGNLCLKEFTQNY